MRPGGGLADLLTEATLTDLAALETEVLDLEVEDPDMPGRWISYDDVCEPIYAGGPCFFISLFGPGNPWNNDPADDPGGACAACVYRTPEESLAQLLVMATAWETANPGAPVNGIHGVVTDMYQGSDYGSNPTTAVPGIKTDMFKVTMLGNIELDAEGYVTAVGDASLFMFEQGVDRDTLSFTVWDIVSWNLPTLSDVERFEGRFSDWAGDPDGDGVDPDDPKEVT
eukprot:SAG11_NODE_10005_length_863_cov_0.849476_1_plen_225_part_10